MGAGFFLLTFLAVATATVLMHQRHGQNGSVVFPVDAAIVLGGGVEPGGTLSWASRRRVAVGVGLLREGRVRRLIMSEGSDDPSATGADLMRQHALALGAAPEAVLIENEARSTFENIRFSYEVAERAGLVRLAIVTDDFHLLRARALACFFGRCDIEPVSVPTLGRAPATDSLRDLGRESLAWWYNLGKIGAWSALGAAGLSEERRGWIVE